MDASVEERWDCRTRTLIGDDAADRLAAASVLVVGVGGVGGYVAEMLARSGVGHLTLVDADIVSVSNLNRQPIALRSSLGKPKVEEYVCRFADINPELKVDALNLFLTPGEAGELLGRGAFDYVADAIDTVAPKAALLAECLARRIPVVSSMGAGGRTDPTRVICTDLWKTRDDGLARAVRLRLRRMGLKGRRLDVVASTEPPRQAPLVEVNTANKRTSPGSIATVPATFGIFMAAKIINSIAGMR